MCCPTPDRTRPKRKSRLLCHLHAILIQHASLHPRLLRQQYVNALPSVLGGPDTVVSASPPFIAVDPVASSPAGLAHDDVQVAFLRAHPVDDKVGGIFAQRGEESVLG